MGHSGLVCVCVWERPAVTAGGPVFVQTPLFFVSTWGLYVSLSHSGRGGGVGGWQPEQTMSPLMRRKYKAKSDGRQIFPVDGVYEYEESFMSIKAHQGLYFQQVERLQL